MMRRRQWEVAGQAGLALACGFGAGLLWPNEPLLALGLAILGVAAVWVAWHTVEVVWREASIHVWLQGGRR